MRRAPQRGTVVVSAPGRTPEIYRYDDMEAARRQYSGARSEAAERLSDALKRVVTLELWEGKFPSEARRIAWKEVPA